MLEPAQVPRNIKAELVAFSPDLATISKLSRLEIAFAIFETLRLRTFNEIYGGEDFKDATASIFPCFWGKTFLGVQCGQHAVVFPPPQKESLPENMLSLPPDAIVEHRNSPTLLQTIATKPPNPRPLVNVSVRTGFLSRQFFLT